MNSDATCVEFPLSGNVISNTPTLFGVFDGLGGEECGEIASYIAAKTTCCPIKAKDSLSFLNTLCQKANDEICRYMKENLVFSMGTTAAMVLFDKKNITLCNVGDSRIYHISKNEMSQISKDHVAFSVQGQKPPLSQSLGIPPEEIIIQPHFVQSNYVCGDKYLICSDGLTDMVSEEDIKSIIDENDINEAIKALLNKTLENGGRDNVTIILLEIKQKRSLFFK